MQNNFEKRLPCKRRVHFVRAEAFYFNASLISNAQSAKLGFLRVLSSKLLLAELPYLEIGDSGTCKVSIIYADLINSFLISSMSTKIIQKAQLLVIVWRIVSDSWHYEDKYHHLFMSQWNLATIVHVLVISCLDYSNAF